MTWFAKIDSDCDGFVEWDECFDFLVSMGEQNYFGKPSGEDRLHPCEEVHPVPSRHGHLSMMTRVVVIEEHDKYASVGRDGSLKVTLDDDTHRLHTHSVFGRYSTARASCRASLFMSAR